MGTPPTTAMVGKGEAVEIEVDSAGAMDVGRGGMDWPVAGEVEVSGLRLRYRPTLPLALRQVDFRVAPGRILGVVGRTGSGKSTLFTALFRLVEAEAGSIRVDGIDVLGMDLHTLRRGLTVIPQDPTLFEGTVRSNLDPFGEFDDEQVWDALRTCHLSLIHI